jgi:hypothetical protein
MRIAHGFVAATPVALVALATPACKVTNIESHGLSEGGPECAVFTSHSVDARVTVDGELRVPQGCSIEMPGDLVVSPKGTLTLDKGVTLRFHAGKELTVGGTLIVKGTADAPVSLTSAASAPAPGDWSGIIFYRGAGATAMPPTSVLSHAHVSFAGPAARDSFSSGCVTNYDGMSLELTDSTLDHCKGAGFAETRAGTSLRAFTHNKLHDNTTSVDVDANLLGSVKDCTLGDAAHVRGTVTTSQKWHVDVPIVVVETLKVELASPATGPAPVLELADDSKLRFTPDAALRVGDLGPGAVVAHRVTFSSAADQPKAGDWAGIELGTRAEGTRITDCTIEHAGHRANARVAGAALRMWAQEKKPASIELRNLSFRDTDKGSVAIGAAGGGNTIDCTALTAAGNHSADVALCSK